MNYVYGMLYGEVWRAVIRGGLDPYFGIIHGTERDQGSLVFDLIEEYRAPSDILDLQVTSLKNEYLGNDEYRPFRFQW